MTRVALESDGGVALITLSNPPLNLLTRQLKAELTDVIARVAVERSTRAVVLTGAGGVFSAGSDVREFPSDAAEGEERARFEHACFRSVEDLPIPVIAALHGHVLGGGLELALACDLRVADENASLGMPEVALGVFPSGGGTQRLPRLIGLSRAKKMMLLGSSLRAPEAQAIGLVDFVAVDGRHLQEALDLARSIAQRPALAVRAIKAATAGGLAGGVQFGEEMEARLAGEIFESHDAKEGVRAFLDKRAARFEHR